MALSGVEHCDEGLKKFENCEKSIPGLWIDTRWWFSSDGMMSWCDVQIVRRRKFRGLLWEAWDAIIRKSVQLYTVYNEQICKVCARRRIPMYWFCMALILVILGRWGMSNVFKKPGKHGIRVQYEYYQNRMVCFSGFCFLQLGGMWSSLNNWFSGECTFAILQNWANMGWRGLGDGKYS